jgi:LCP family protein required for cell wall assembly
MQDTPYKHNSPFRYIGVAAIAAAIILIAFPHPIWRAVTQFGNAGMVAKAGVDVASAFGKPRLNVLVLGYQEDEGLTDSVILAHLDLDRHTMTLLSIPRDTWVSVPGYGRMKINAAIAFGGAKSTAKVVTALTGAQIDATMVVEPQGAKQLVDAVGGLNVDIEKDMDYDDSYGNLHIHLKKGERFLTGGQVAGYIRFRHDPEGDYGRMRRQQQVARELMHEMGRPGNWAKLPRLIALARTDVKTELTDKQLEALAELYRSVGPDDIRTLTLPSRTGNVGDASVVFVDERWAKIISSLACTPKAPSQDLVLVVNATGDRDLIKTVVGALRGGGWNVQTFITQRASGTTEVIGSSRTANELAHALAPVKRSDGEGTTVRFGTDFLPNRG